MLQAWDFGVKWYGWIKSLLSSGFSSVLKNGLRGLPFKCKRGLRHGDPRSPYLFIHWVSILSCILTIGLWGGFVQKVGPCNVRNPCRQYDEETIMLLPPERGSIKRVKILIYIFELLSKIFINFHKSSLYALGPSSLDLSQISHVLYCWMGRFSFTYLRLPLKMTTFSKAWKYT